MPRPTKDGAPPAPSRHHKLTDSLIRSIKPEPRSFSVWDTYQPGLVLRVQPTGHKSFRVFYRCQGRPRWLHLENALAIKLPDARDRAARTRLEARDGKDPAADRKAERNAHTFAELSQNYIKQHAIKKNKSWRQADFLVSRYLLPYWGKLSVKTITRADVRLAIGKIEAPMLANQVLAAASAIFSWAMRQDLLTENPCRGVERNPTRSRERVLSDSEVPVFWEAFEGAGLIRGTALKMILLTGQRPGEIGAMRYEHIKDGWWTMPGGPDHKLGWPGTKNKQTHRVWLSAAVYKEVFEELAADDRSRGFVFPGVRGAAVDGLDAAMRRIGKKLVGVERATPHDLRRTFSSKVTGLGFGRDAMNRVTNHKEGGIASVYDRHSYADENKKIMESVADEIMSLVQGRPEDKKVVAGKFGSRR